MSIEIFNYILHMTIFPCVYEKKPNSYCFIKPFIALSGLTCLYLNNLTAFSVLVFLPGIHSFGF